MVRNRGTCAGSLEHANESQTVAVMYTNPMESISDGLSVGARIGLLRAGLLSESQIKVLILDALAQNIPHYLPRDLVEVGRKMVTRGEWKIPDN